MTEPNVVILNRPEDDWLSQNLLHSLRESDAPPDFEAIVEYGHTSIRDGRISAISKTHGDFVLVADNDTQVPQLWWKTFRAMFETRPDINRAYPRVSGKYVEGFWYEPIEAMPEVTSLQPTQTPWEGFLLLRGTWARAWANGHTERDIYTGHEATVLIGSVIVHHGISYQVFSSEEVAITLLSPVFAHMNLMHPWGISSKSIVRWNGGSINPPVPFSPGATFKLKIPAQSGIYRLTLYGDNGNQYGYRLRF